MVITCRGSSCSVSQVGCTCIQIIIYDLNLSEHANNQLIFLVTKKNCVQHNAIIKDYIVVVN